MVASLSSIKSIQISGNKPFLEIADGIISRLRRRGVPLTVETNEQGNSHTEEIPGCMKIIDDEGVIEIEFTEPVDNIRGGLFCVTNGVMPTRAVLNRFKLVNPRQSGEPYTQGVELSIHHDEFKESLEKELAALIGEF